MICLNIFTIQCHMINCNEHFSKNEQEYFNILRAICIQTIHNVCSLSQETSICSYASVPKQSNTRKQITNIDKSNSK